jgi:hypothetical protein
MTSVFMLSVVVISEVVILDLIWIILFSFYNI